MPIIPAPTSDSRTAAEIKADALAAGRMALGVAEANLAEAISQARTAGAMALYGSSEYTAAELLASLGRSGVALIAADILQRQLQEMHAAGTGVSPVPPGLTLSVSGADIDAFMSAHSALVASFLAAGTGVTVSAAQ